MNEGGGRAFNQTVSFPPKIQFCLSACERTYSSSALFSFLANTVTAHQT